MNNAAIENFIKKVRLAQNAKAKDLRLTLEEAQDLIASIAMINNHTDKLSEVVTKLDDISKSLSQPQSTGKASGGVNGGTF